MTAPFEWLETPYGSALVCRTLEPVAHHLFTTRAWLLGSPDADSAHGWTEVARAMGVDDAHLGRLHQVHGASTVMARGPLAAHLPEGDIIVSDDAAMAVAIRTADCVPLLVADRKTGATAAVHAGWRGLAARAPEVAVGELASRFGSVPRDLIVAIGPAIGACCYEVGDDVRARFRREGFSDAELQRWFSAEPLPSPANPSMPALPAERRPNHWFFAASDVARDQIVQAGVPAPQVHVASLCTASHQAFCSYRRDGGGGSGRLVAAIRPLPRRP